MVARPTLSSGGCVYTRAFLMRCKRRGKKETRKARCILFQFLEGGPRNPPTRAIPIITIDSCVVYCPYRFLGEYAPSYAERKRAPGSWENGCKAKGQARGSFAVRDCVISFRQAT